MPGVKHLIDCHCVLALYKQKEKIINHKFPVYSKVDNNGLIIPKLAKCNNCDTLHNVYDICKSEIKAGKDQTNVVVTKDDLSLMLPDKLSNLLIKIDSDISVWEHVCDIIEEERWNEIVVIKRDIVDENHVVKILEILSEDKFKIKSEIINSILR
jgi:hypothetical protein